MKSIFDRIYRMYRIKKCRKSFLPLSC